MPVIVALVAGLIFGAGLTVSQMVNPAKVLAFLDFAAIRSGGWDPSLALVMGGALIVSAPAFYLARQRARALLGGDLALPAARRIDRKLALGAVVFGLGWGLVGFCPGPAVSALSFGSVNASIFFAALVAGMVIFEATAARVADASCENVLA